MEQKRKGGGKRGGGVPARSGGGGEGEQSGDGLGLLRTGSLIGLALLVGYLNLKHVASLFENDRHFSHLSNLEREMTFRTEMGLYYSYFKTIVEADSLASGVYQLYSNNLTEYPLVINTLKRFNLYPELLIGVLYRGFNSLGWLSQSCWTVNRGEGLEPVNSCEGLADPPHFYLAAVWLSAGLTTATLFLLAALLAGGSLTGGLLAVACFFYNHGEATRVMWTPPLRESFAFPLCLLQVLAVSVSLRSSSPSRRHMAAIASLTTAFIITWQFAQFMLFTQVSAVFCTYMLGVISRKTVSTIMLSLVIGLLQAAALLFGNEMLFTSWLFSSLCAALLLSTLLHPLLHQLPTLLRLPVQGGLYLAVSLGLKAGLAAVLHVQDDAHVFELLKAKFKDYKSFHTLLYTCAVEFDFLGWEMPGKICLTLLLPSVLLALVLVIYAARRPLLAAWTGQAVAEEDAVDPAVVYNVLQTVVYAVMAVLIMRLKLFLTPHLCILAGLLCSRKYVPFFKTREMHVACIVGLLAAMSIQGYSNIREQRSIIGEYSDIPMEEMLEWINKNVAPDGVFAGAMPTMANLLLSTRRPIVNHPHYEDTHLRERTKKVYSMFSRRSVADVARILSELRVEYLVLTKHWCLTTARGGCALTEVWDIEEPQNVHRKPVCPELWHKAPAPFHRVFANDNYQILRLPRQQG